MKLTPNLACKKPSIGSAVGTKATSIDRIGPSPPISGPVKLQEARLFKSLINARFEKLDTAYSKLNPASLAAETISDCFDFVIGGFFSVPRRQRTGHEVIKVSCMAPQFYISVAFRKIPAAKASGLGGDADFSSATGSRTVDGAAAATPVKVGGKEEPSGCLSSGGTG